MISPLDPLRIPESAYLTADFGKYITPKLFTEFHTKEDRDSFTEWMKHGHVTIDPVGDFAFCVYDYEKWLASEGRI